MRYLLLVFILVSCISSPSNNRQVFDNFHSAFEKRDFNSIDSLLSDSLVSIILFSGDTSSKVSYMKYLQTWSTTFQTKWNVESISEDKETIESIEYDTDMYNNYFFRGTVKFRYKYFFENDKISKILIDSLPGYGQKMAISDIRFNRFYEWVAQKNERKLKYFGQYNLESATEIKKLFTEYLKLQNTR